jgi:hypothetical protein
MVIIFHQLLEINGIIGLDFNLLELSHKIMNFNVNFSILQLNYRLLQ